MVKSNLKEMPRSRKPRFPPELLELLERLEELKRRAPETRRRNEQAIARAEMVQRRLRDIYRGY